MTLQEFNVKLQKLASDFQPGSEGLAIVMRGACFGALAEVKQRIHGEGKAADGSDIGAYNTTTPIYVNPENSPVSFKPLGKNAQYTYKEKKFKDFDETYTIKVTKRLKPGQHKLSNGKERLTKYFNSYSDFKTEIGRNQLGKVNLFLFGGMSNQLTVIANGTGFGIGWIPGQMEQEGKRVATQTYNQRARALELKYGKTIWGLTPDEKQKAIAAGQIEMNKYLSNAIS